METKVSVQYCPVGLAATKLGQPELFCAGKHHNHSLLCLRAEKQSASLLLFVLSKGKWGKLVPTTRLKPR